MKLEVIAAYYSLYFKIHDLYEGRQDRKKYDQANYQNGDSN